MTQPGGGANDVAILQTATSLAVVAGSTYQAVQGLPFGGGPTALPLLRDYLAGAVAAVGTARSTLTDATRAAGGRPQSGPDPRYASVAAQALPTLRSPGDVVALALTIEDVLVQTLVADAVALSTPDRRRLATVLASAAGGRKALLLILQSLLSTGRADLVAVPPDLSALPVGAGTVGFPDARVPTDKASPATEGALR